MSTNLKSLFNVKLPTKEQRQPRPKKETYRLAIRFKDGRYLQSIHTQNYGEFRSIECSDNIYDARLFHSEATVQDFRYENDINVQFDIVTVKLQGKERVITYSKKNTWYGSGSEKYTHVITECEICKTKLTEFEMMRNEHNCVTCQRNLDTGKIHIPQYNKRRVMVG